jgi:hypothetical protein
MNSTHYIKNGGIERKLVPAPLVALVILLCIQHIIYMTMERYLETSTLDMDIGVQPHVNSAMLVVRR